MNMKRLLGKDAWQDGYFVGNKIFMLVREESIDHKLPVDRGSNIVFPELRGFQRAIPLGVTITDMRGFKHLVYGILKDKVTYFTVPERYSKYYVGNILSNGSSLMDDKSTWLVSATPLNLSLEDLFWDTMRHSMNNLIINYEDL